MITVVTFASAEHFPLSKYILTPLFPLSRLADQLAELSTGSAFQESSQRDYISHKHNISQVK